MKKHPKHKSIQKYKNCNQNFAQEYFANTYFSLTLYWKDDLIYYIDIGTSGRASYPTVTFSAFSSVVQRAMNQYQLRQELQWPSPPLNWSGVTPFQERVYKILLQTVPWGQTISYGNLAQLCNVPGGARAVGQAMACNPWPLIVPCHRVLSANGRIGGFSSGPELKKTLLNLEGRN